MCGIAGFIGHHGNAEERSRVLKRMLDRIAHRGPDDSGVWHDDTSGSAIGMRRLSIIDLAGGHQPMWNEDGTIGVVFNGEIYNHRPLRAGLQSRGHQFRTQSDTEVLVHLYEEHGTALFDHLQGMYAIAIVDRRRQTLLLARDPFGQKPIYLFAPTPGVLAFASEAKSLRAVQGWTGEIDPAAYLDYVAWFSLPAPQTHWHHVEKLRPGEWQVYALADGRRTDGGIRRAILFANTPSTAGEEQLCAELLTSLEDSVSRHLEADVPVGLLLSGGTDSLVIGWITSRVIKTRLHTFTAGFAEDGGEFDAARRTANLLSSEHHEVILEPDILAREIDRVIFHLDEPIADPAAIAVLRLCTVAREHVKVLLGGEGSDELFAGYGDRYAGILHTLAETAMLRATIGWLPSRATSFGRSPLSRAWARAHLSPMAEILALRAEGLQPFLPWAQQHARPALALLRQRCEHHAASLPRQPDPLSAAQAVDLAWQLPESLLVKADRMSMAASLELRCPFLDPAVAAVAGRVPPTLRLARESGLGKIILRRLLARHLPEDALRPKIGFQLPLGRWLRGPLAGDVRARLTDSSSAFVGLFGAKAATAWCDEFAASRVSAHATYGLWIYERWRTAAR